MLLLTTYPELQNKVLMAMMVYLNHEDVKIRDGFKEKIRYLNEYNADIVIIEYSGGNQPMFDISFHKKDKHTHPENERFYYPESKDKKPFMVGGLVLHSNGDWGVHT